MVAPRARSFAAGLCGTLGILLILTALILGYATRSLFNERAFADRVAASHARTPLRTIPANGLRG